MPRSFATALSVSGLLYAQDRRPERLSAAARQASSASRRCRASGSRAPGPTVIAAACTPIFWRSAPFPALTVFDAPDATTTCTRRNRSNTPLQALTLLNDKAYFEFAQALAARVLKEAKPDDAERIRHAFRLCVARSPSKWEEKRLAQLLAQQMADFEKSPEDAEGHCPHGCQGRMRKNRPRGSWWRGRC